jgi:hypothetical protein
MSNFSVPIGTGMSAKSRLAWYYNRLRCMSAAEIAHRVSRATAAQLEKLGMWFQDSVPPANLIAQANDFLLVDSTIDPQPYVMAAEAVLRGHLNVFAVDYEFGMFPQWNRDPKSGRVAPLSFGKTLNYRNEALVGDIKYLWEPNRHLHLVTLGQAWSLTHDLRYLRAIARQIKSWIAQCPYPKGPNWTSSLELAIRLINWSLLWQLIGGLQSPLFSLEETNLRERWLQTIYRHLSFVAGHQSLYSSANNHLIGELSGLLVGAATWPYWSECKSWANTALINL